MLYYYILIFFGIEGHFENLQRRGALALTGMGIFFTISKREKNSWKLRG
jgi:hypothetical protein